MAFCLSLFLNQKVGPLFGETLIERYAKATGTRLKISLVPI
jgi:hypothetical protein